MTAEKTGTAPQSSRLIPTILWVFVLVILLAVSNETRADLLQYVQRPEPAFAWKLKEKINHPLGGTIYDLQLTSQVWQGITWEHQLQIYQPPNAKPNSTMLLYNTGGAASDGNKLFGMELARLIGAPCAFLYHIPNQPLLDGKKEDTLIAETFVRYLDTKDENWPLLFPMVKSLVKGMDVLQVFTAEEFKLPVTKFIVSGASKRGWTTWLTAAADSRVKAIAPMVIDTLNMQDQGPYQLKSFGKYSDQVRDYTARGLLPMPETPEAKRLWSMVDPWVYRERLSLPKLLINGVNDPYWTTDALNLYWNDLKGEKWVLYVPNAGHDLQQKLPDGTKNRTAVINGLAAFARHQTKDNPMPQVAWKHDDGNGKLRLTVTADQAPNKARLWVAEAPTRDFRLATWREQPAIISGGKVTGEVSPPTTGCLAFFAELDYEIDGLSHHLSTQLRIAEAEKK